MRRITTTSSTRHPEFSSGSTTIQLEMLKRACAEQGRSVQHDGLCVTLTSITLAFLLLFSFQQSHAQQTINDVIDSTLTIQRDVRIDSLVMRHIRVNALRDGLNGYRLQLFSGSGTTARQEANQLRADFMARNPDVPAYLIYQAPNFKVRVGDYRTELEAIKLQRELEYRWPGAFVVRDEIKFPKLAIEQEQDQEEELEEETSPEDGED